MRYQSEREVRARLYRTDKCDGLVSVVLEVEEREEGEQVAGVQGPSRWVHAEVDGRR